MRGDFTPEAFGYLGNSGGVSSWRCYRWGGRLYRSGLKVPSVSVIKDDGSEKWLWLCE